MNEIPCWEHMGCPEALRSECPVFQDGSLFCWEYEITRCKDILQFDHHCEDCRYYYARVLARAGRRGPSHRE